jgi:hypothetical protein
MWLSVVTADGGTRHGRLRDARVPLFKKTAADHIVTEHDNPSDWQRFAGRSIEKLRALGL